MYLAMSKETDPAIVAKLQNALDAARAAGELDAIQARYE
jgi:polar amino acid transport system substrate-binding protein